MRKRRVFTVVPSMVRENRACAPVVGCLRPHSPPPFRPAALPPLVAAIPCSPRASSTSTGVYIHDIEVRALCSCVLTQGCSRSATCALCSPATLSPCSFFCLLLVRRRKVGRGPGLSAAPVHRLPGANQRGRAHRALFRLIFGEDLACAWPSLSSRLDSQFELGRRPGRRRCLRSAGPRGQR